jgi:predicted PurR-regulated permease PerM
LVALAPVVVVRIVSPSVSTSVVLVASAAAIAAAAWVRRTRIEPTTIRPGVVLSAVAVAVGVDIAGFAGVVAALIATGAVVALLTTTCPMPTLPSALEPSAIAGERDLEVHGAEIGAGRWTWPGQVDSWRSALTLIVAAVGGVLAWTLLGHFGHALVWIVVAGMLAIALNRPVRFLVNHRVPRPGAVALVFVLAIAVVAAAGLAGVRGGVATTTKLSKELPQVVTDLEDAPFAGDWLREHNASTWVDDQLNDLPQRIESGRGVGDYLPMVGNRLLDLLWVVLLAMALLLDGPRLFAAVERRVPVRHRRQFVRVVDAAHRAVGGYLAGAALVAALNAAVVFFIALSLGITLAPVLAMWAFLWNFVPQVGGFMGGFPLVVLALSVGPVQAIAAALLFIAYQFTENHVIQPAVISEAIDVPPWATLLTALGGGAAAGLLGAVVLTPLVGVVRVVLNETKRADFPGRTAATTPELIGVPHDHH